MLPNGIRKIFNGLKSYWEARETFKSDLKALEETVKSGTPEKVAEEYPAISASRFFKPYHSSDLLIAALKRDDVSIFRTVLPDNNVNHFINAGSHTDTPVLCAAIGSGSRKIALDLANDPNIDPRATSVTSIVSMAGGGACAMGPPATELAARAGMHDVGAALRAKLPEQQAPRWGIFG